MIPFFDERSVLKKRLGLVLRMRQTVYSSKDFESLWFLYQAEGLPKNISIEELTFPSVVELNLKCETYALSDQLRRAVVSVPSNIAEGSGRCSVKEKIHFLEIAYGSLTETLCQLDIAHDLEYITDVEFNNIQEKIDVIGKLLSGLHNSFMKQL